ncbi:MAG TPA: hypothetical protein PK313_14370, partial [Myxococcota bacterium]|nr:hypothetical protein [Myxococcota bacterium]
MSRLVPPAARSVRGAALCLAVLATAWAGSVRAREAAAPPDPCVGAPVVSSALEGCAIAACKARDFDAAIRALADLAPGSVHDAASLAAARARLMRLDLFRSVAFACSPVDGGIDVRVQVVPGTWIRRIRVVGNRHFYESRILDRLSVFPGDRLDPG